MPCSKKILTSSICLSLQRAVMTRSRRVPQTTHIMTSQTTISTKIFKGFKPYFRTNVFMEACCMKIKWQALRSSCRTFLKNSTSIQSRKESTLTHSLTRWWMKETQIQSQKPFWSTHQPKLTPLSLSKRRNARFRPRFFEICSTNTYLPQASSSSK